MTFTGPPARMRLFRRAGFNLQAASIALNGRAAFNCARSGPLGNPFTHDPGTGAPLTPAESGRLFARMLKKLGYFVNKQGRTITRADVQRMLKDRNGACFCDTNFPHCHVITLLEIANGD